MFSANCMILGSRVPVTWPKLDVPSVVPTVLKLVWLNTLKASARNWKCVPSVTAMFFIKPTSHLEKPGPRTVPRPAFPGRPLGAAANAAVLHHFVRVGGPEFGFPPLSVRPLAALPLRATPWPAGSKTVVYAVYGT